LVVIVALSTTTLAPGATATFTTTTIEVNMEPPIEPYFGNFRVEAQGEVVP
jgi:hypothetical protein